VAAGFDAASPALFVWEGVTYYLSDEAVRATLRRVASGCHPQSGIVFDYVMRNMIEKRRLHEHHEAALELVAGVGEPFRWGTNDPLPICYEEGLRHVRTTSFAEACLTLTGTYDRAREFRFQHFCYASVAPRAGF
jgi:O-methyltransferase involved in polyketide biosynthesis